MCIWTDGLVCFLVQMQNEQKHLWEVCLFRVVVHHLSQREARAGAKAETGRMGFLACSLSSVQLASYTLQTYLLRDVVGHTVAWAFYIS